MSRSRCAGLILTAAVLLWGTGFGRAPDSSSQDCSTGGAKADPHEKLYPGMARHRADLVTVPDGARDYFDQGMTFLYAFNFEAAVQSFRAAARSAKEEGSSCAACCWGVGYARGPNINDSKGRPNPHL